MDECTFWAEIVNLIASSQLNSCYANMLASEGGRGCGGGKTRNNVGKPTIPWQKHNNWEHSEMLACINYKHAKHSVQKQLIDLR